MISRSKFRDTLNISEDAILTDDIASQRGILSSSQHRNDSCISAHLKSFGPNIARILEKYINGFQ
jgi:hypothetical protein